jgi:5-methyltetrahydrofolate--homocysteine methyltransferase
MVDYAQLRQDLYDGKMKEVESTVQAALDDGVSADEILHEGLIKGMDRVGEDFKNCVLYVPNVLIAARAMRAGMALLKPHLSESGARPVGTLILGTVQGDLHDIGKNLVGMMMEGAGFKVVDLGVDVKPDQFITAAKENGAQLIGMSALLTTTMVNMKGVIEALKGADLPAKVLIGGAPVTQSFADEIGAHGYAPDAASAVDKAKELLKAAA